ncbi:MAG: hypothetical protein RL220_307, partial [Bacteroidota bacterium]
MPGVRRILLFACLALVSRNLCAQGGANFYSSTDGYTDFNYVLSGQGITYVAEFANTGETIINEITFTFTPEINLFDISTIEIIGSSHVPLVSYDNESGVVSITISAASLYPAGLGSSDGFFWFSMNSLPGLPHNTPLEVSGT